MNTWSILKLGLGSLYLYKLRSLSTMLGIVFGVAAVIAMLSIGAGAKQETLRQISFLGIKNIWIKYQKMSDQKIEEEINLLKKQGKNNIKITQGFNAKQIEHLKAICPNLQFITPVRELSMDIISPLNGKKLDLKVMAVEPAYYNVANTQIDKGRFISYLDMSEEKRICVLGPEAKRKIFAWRDPIGQYIRIGGQHFSVVGITRNKNIPKGSTDINKDIYVPFATALKYFGEEHPIKNTSSEEYQQESGEQVNKSISVVETAISEICCRMKNELLAEETGQIIAHSLKKTNPDGNYNVIVPYELLAQSRRAEWLFTVVMGSIAAISLLVGGIGVMNTMLATISERTREIGLRRAIGAKKRHIIKQFIVETLVLTVGGGVIGIFLGVGFSKIIPLLVPTYITIIAAYSIIVAFSVSVLIGIIFGLYPAYRAANINPIEALKYE
ncbi:MAG: ABC transporter permease [Planctomycetota bacterium]